MPHSRVPLPGLSPVGCRHAGVSLRAPEVPFTPVCPPRLPSAVLTYCPSVCPPVPTPPTPHPPFHSGCPLQLQLSRVIRGRAAGEFVPTKSHLLTRVLGQAFGGNSRTALLVTISPVKRDLKATMHSLQFAALASAIHNRPRFNTARPDVVGFEAALYLSLLRRFAHATAASASPVSTPLGHSAALGHSAVAGNGGAPGQGYGLDSAGVRQWMELQGCVTFPRGTLRSTCSAAHDCAAHDCAA